MFTGKNLYGWLENWNLCRYSDVIISSIAFQITSVLIVCSTVCSGADQRKHQSSASLAFLRGIHQWPVDSPHKRPVTLVHISLRHHVLLQYIGRDIMTLLKIPYTKSALRHAIAETLWAYVNTIGMHNTIKRASTDLFYLCMIQTQSNLSSPSIHSKMRTSTPKRLKNSNIHEKCHVSIVNIQPYRKLVCSIPCCNS